jgi:hypothetical protein
MPFLDDLKKGNSPWRVLLVLEATRNATCQNIFLRIARSYLNAGAESVDILGNTMLQFKELITLRMNPKSLPKRVFSTKYSVPPHDGFPWRCLVDVLTTK